MTSGRPPPGHRVNRSPQPERPHEVSGERPSGVRLIVVSDRQLVADAVAAALTSLQLAVSVRAWPLTPRGDRLAGAGQKAAEHGVDHDVALLLYDVDLSLRLARARTILWTWAGPWVVLTGTPSGPAWGGLRSAGAAAIAPDDLSLAELDRLLRRVAAGDEPPGTAALDEQVDAWRSIQDRHDQVQRRIDSLAPREREVLALLQLGVPVVTIAREWGLAEATVRTHVRGILRKLGVRSQLAALALVRSVDEAESVQSLEA